MKLAIFGATGRTGAQLVQQALAAGHDVTAVARNPHDLRLSHGHLNVLRGDVLDPAAVEAAVLGQDAVVSCIGGSTSQKPVTLYSAGAGNIIRAMQDDGVRRLMCISANPLVVGNGDALFDRFVLKPVVRAIFKESYADLTRMEEELRRSTLDWTIMRPPRLTDRPSTDQYRIAFDRNLPRGRFIGRSDLAGAMLRLLGDPKSIHAAVTVAY
jgi:putative NADH-flavin reductase